MKNNQQNELSPKYYLDNFHSLLLFVESKYGELLHSNEKAFVQAFRGLSEDGQCLFLRFANRKGLFFRTDKLNYQEINSIEHTLEELLFKQFCTFPTAIHKPLAAEFLSVYAREELCSIYKMLAPERKGLSRFKKHEIVGLLLETFSWEELLTAADAVGPVIKHAYEHELEVLKFLYFGYLGGDMSEFVVRDLGMVRYEVPEESQLVARFQSRKEVDDVFAVSVAYQHFRELRDEGSAEKLYSWYQEWSARQKELCESAQQLFNRLTLKLARLLERLQQPHWAIEVYERTEQVPSRERRVRLLNKTGAGQEALELCNQIEASPQNADELFFAKDYKARLLKKRETKSTTKHLKEAETVAINSSYRYQVEKGVVHYLQENGGQALYAENYLWRSLFGLVFWDIVFDLDAPVYHSPLQRAPSGLFLPQYMESRQDCMVERMDLLASPEKLLKHVEEVYEAKWGIGNPLVGWHENTLPLVRAACQKIAPSCLKEVFLEMARNLKENSRGFPDLFSWTAEGYAFIEVKSPNDTLSAQQLFWLRFFKECGIEARVLRVEWIEAPETDRPQKLVC